MNFMKNSVNVMQKELFYQLKSKRLMILLIAIVGIVLLHLYGLYNSVISNYHLYLQTEQMYIENGLDIIESLKETNYVVTERNTSITSNPLKEDFVNLAISIQNLDANSIISNSLEYFIFVFGTLIFGIYAAYVATYDYKFHTHKFFSSQYKQSELLTGKLLSIFIVLFGSLFLLGVIAYCASPILKWQVRKTVPIEKYMIPDLSYENHLLIQILFTIALLGFYIIISYTAAFILKNMLPVTIFLLLYTLLIPVLGKYDVKNICSFFAQKIFSFKARFVVFQATDISPACGVAVIALMLFASCIALFFTSKRSSYS